MSRVTGAAIVTALLAVPASAGERPAPTSVRQAVAAVVPALMARDRIPGMAVAVTVDGKAYTFYYGAASLRPRIPVTADTLFEIGSVTKTFTATLASLAQVRHRLSLADTTKRYVPTLRGTPFGNVTLLSLGTHTPGGLPLQFPDGIMSDAELVRYFEKWRPTYPIGTVRTYTNQGIGMLGYVTAKSMGGDFDRLMQDRLLPALGLRHTYVTVPTNERARYAWGFRDDGRPIRMTPGTLEAETYGIRTTADDLIRFVQDNIDPSGLPEQLREAVMQTHTGYFGVGPMTQDLIWEQYPYPVTLASLLSGSSPHVLFDAVPVRAIVPARPPVANAWLNKTGSTNGFGTYVAYVPAKRIGIAILANENYPIRDRVTAAYRILRAVTAASAP